MIVLLILIEFTFTNWFRFGDKILYHGYDGEKHCVITTEEGVKETLITSLSKLPKGQAQFAIIVENIVIVKELTKPGVPSAWS